VDPRDLGLAPNAPGAPRQRPYAAVLGCSDARVPIELIFNERPNDLFVVRVAGNGLGSEVLGSLKYAVDHLGGSLKPPFSARTAKFDSSNLPERDFLSAAKSSAAWYIVIARLWSARSLSPSD
jgi:Carbonic anhydrase